MFKFIKSLFTKSVRTEVVYVVIDTTDTARNADGIDAWFTAYVDAVSYARAIGLSSVNVHEGLMSLSIVVR